MSSAPLEETGNSAQSASQQSNQTWIDQVLHSVSEGVIQTDEDLRIISINAAGLGLCGWSKPEVCAKRVADLFAIDALDTKSLSTHSFDALGIDSMLGQSHEHTVIRTVSGETKSIRLRVDKVGQDAAPGYLFVFEAVDRIRNLENESERAQKVESLAILAGGIAHDLNNNLQAIMSSIMAVNLASGMKHDSLLGVAQTACIKSRELVRQLLQFARGGESMLQLESVESIVRDSALLAFSGTDTTAEFLVADNLPLTFLYRSQIEQVFANLFINAQQAMKQGGVVLISIELATLPSDPSQHAVLVKIKDHGSGINPESIERIFEPYFTTKPEGHGLGLTTTRAVIKRHQGQLTVESVIGVGTEFCVYLPVSVIEAPAEESESPS